MLRVVKKELSRTFFKYVRFSLFIRYVFYVSVFLVAFLFDKELHEMGFRNIKEIVFLLALMGWTPILSGREKIVRRLFFMTLLSEEIALCYLTILTGGIESTAAVTFPALAIAYGFAFDGLMAYSVPVLLPIVSATTVYVLGFNRSILQLAGGFWMAGLDYVCTMGIIYYKKKIGEYTQIIKEIALRDELTGLKNYRSFWMELSSELSRANRYQRPLSVIMIDLDGFKAVNDRFGHMTGDELLAAIGRSIKNSLRKSDNAYRYGGDEFAIILPETDGAGAEEVVRRIEKMISRTIIYRGNSIIKASSTSGVTTYYPVDDSEPDPEEIVDAADRDLLKKKKKKKVTLKVIDSA